ncbi:MAG: hypothetical protein HKN04_11330 [Rhodothermaceae bacterium]|nr:hypothetical protein [Rhodothermaceae bacterium]
MAYIDGEVRAVCQTKGWGHQVRRNWSARRKPVAESPIDDYEWKLIPEADGKLPDDLEAGFNEGVYYVLSFDKVQARFVFQHDTSHGGAMGSHWEETTYTQIRRLDEETGLFQDQLGGSPPLPPAGWLRDHLLALTNRFTPNSFSLT